MNSNGVIGFVIGGAICSTITYFLTRNVYLKRSNNEIQAYKDYIKQKNEKTSSNDIPEKAESESKSDWEKTKDIATDKVKKIIRENGYSAALTVEEAEATGDEELIEAADITEKFIKSDERTMSSTVPTVINQSIFTGEDEFGYKCNFEHITLDWYAGDTTLAFSHSCEVMGVEFAANEVVENVRRLVGDEWKSHFGDKDYGNDEDCVYVRNSDYRCDFEIIRDPGKYREIVEGIFDEEESD